MIITHIIKGINKGAWVWEMLCGELSAVIDSHEHVSVENADESNCSECLERFRELPTKNERAT